MSTGNDIVFLPATRPERTAHPRFYPRIITPAEQQMAHSIGLPFDRYVWLCWSIKESAYKYYRRIHPGLSFAPLKFAVSGLSHNGEFYFSTVTADPGLLYARCAIRNDVIVAVVSDDPEFTHTHWGFQPIGSSAYPTQSSAVRTLALQELKTVLRRDDLHIGKDAEGCPCALAPDLSLPISLAHHDRYVAWSFTC